MDTLSSEMNEALDRIHPGLAWEIGPGKQAPHMLAISPEGDPTLREIADSMIKRAPGLKGWEFYSSRQPRSAPKVISLPERGLQFDTSGWKFVPVERPDSGRIDLIVVDHQLGCADKDAALKAVSIYIDALLGEDEVEKWLGIINLRQATNDEKQYPIQELPDYILWATHREKSPLTRL
jgi:hypothetical protein